MNNIPADLTDQLKERVERVEGVVKGSAEFRTRFVGNRPYVEIKLATPRGGSLESAHRLSEVVEKTIRALSETHEEMSELERTLKSLIPELARVHIDPEISNPD
jgi:divalent metal cation (Fe/Co/Zn/Cd) transporter